MTSAESRAVWDRLYREYLSAEHEHRRILAESTRILADLPMGLPLGDGQYRQMQAAAEARAAFEVYQGATERFRAFVDEGIVPDDLVRGEDR